MLQALFVRPGNSQWEQFDNVRLQVFVQGSIVDSLIKLSANKSTSTLLFLTLKMTILIAELFESQLS